MYTPNPNAIIYHRTYTLHRYDEDWLDCTAIVSTTVPIRFCATGKKGIGHLRRVTNIAKVLYLRGYKNLELYTNASVAGLSSAERDIYARVVVCPKAEFTHELSLHGCGPVVVDTAIVEGLDTIDAPLILILRETVENKVDQFRLPSGRLWDQVLIPNPADHWNVEPDTVGAKRVGHVGWIYRSGANSDETIASASVTPHQPASRTIVVASGGGGHVNTGYQATVNAIIEQTRLAVKNEAYFVVAKGPRASTNQLFKSADESRDFGSDLHSAFVSADVVVSTAGYNSVMEIASSTTPALLIPVDTTFDDQLARTERWGPMLGHCHSTIETSSDWLIDLIKHYHRRPSIELGLSGAARAADHVQSFLL